MQTPQTENKENLYAFEVVSHLSVYAEDKEEAQSKAQREVEKYIDREAEIALIEEVKQA